MLQPWFQKSFRNQTEPSLDDMQMNNYTMLSSFEKSNKLAKLGGAIAISKSETINHSLTYSPTDWQTYLKTACNMDVAPWCYKGIDCDVIVCDTAD